MTKFEGSVAVVTGGASGIGKAIAAALAERGARVAIADRAFDQAQAVAAEIGNGARPYRCDVTEPAQIEELAQAVLRDFGGVNLVFANAGVAVGGKMLDTSAEEFKWLFEVNVGGTFATIKAFVPLLTDTVSKGGPAHVIVTGSENSLGVPIVGPSSVYTATKHAVLALADTLRRDLDGSGIGVSILCPGVVDTRIWDARRSRPERFGGEAVMPADFAERASKAMAKGQKPEVTATLCLDGIERGTFMIITDPKIRDFATRRHREVEEALDRADARLTLTGELR